MKLHYREIGTGEPLIILHGLFGSSDNWQTLGKAFAESRRVIFVDQRNHGKSPHSDDFSYDLMVEDLLELVDDLGLEKATILGHSMGGKTAIAFAAKYPNRIQRMIVADISHRPYEHHHDDVIAGLNAIDLTVVKSRGEAEEAMKPFLPDYSVRQFLLKNLYWVEKGQLGWRMNIPSLVKNLDQVIEEIAFDSIETETLFIRGELSNYIPETDFEEIHEKFPHARIETIANSGHWVHHEGAKEFYRLVDEFV